MITSDQIAVIDRSRGFNITTHKTHFEMVMSYIATGCYGGGYGSESHRTALAHFEQQIGAQRENMARQDAEEAERERKAEERKKGPQMDFAGWWVQLIDLADRQGYDPEDGVHSLTDADKSMWQLDYWEQGYTTEDALKTFFDSE